ncbi:MAG TPA: hypothetical protein VJJ23_04480 [Candidatus Nanoarchaeia archaeon]|nr:hypothetical protein [Candidatus Nanoarchaeia archaeon]
MQTQKLNQILEQSTHVYRKGEVLEKRQEGNVNITEFFGYPHTNEAPVNGVDKIDMIFIDVVVDKERAEQYRNEITDILRDYPEPERLAGGPSYIELAPNLGMQQEGALRLMALGKSLGLWDILSGKTLKMNDDEARNLAGSGFLMISGYKP